MLKYRCNCVIVLSAKIENTHKALDFNTTILLGNSRTNVPAESPRLPKNSHIVSLYLRQRNFIAQSTMIRRFIIELIKCSLLCLLLQHSPHQMCFPRFNSCFMLIVIKINSISLFFIDVDIVDLVLDILLNFFERFASFTFDIMFMLAFTFEFSALWVTERVGCTVISAVFFSTHVCFEISFEVPFDFFDFTFRSLTPSFFSAVFNQGSIILVRLSMASVPSAVTLSRPCNDFCIDALQTSRILYKDLSEAG